MFSKISLLTHCQKKSKNTAFSIVEISVVILIISLLLAGILNGTSLIGDASIATAQKLTTNADVNNMESLTLWLETSFTSSLEAQGNKKVENDIKINRWKDNSPLKSPTKRFDFIQTASTNQPTYKEDVIDGLPMLYFTTSNSLEFFSSTSTLTQEKQNQNLSLADLMQNNQATIFIVCMFDKSASGAKLINFNNVVNFGYNANKIEMIFDGNNLIESSDSLKTETLQMISAIKNIGKIEFYLNGNLRSNISSSATIADTNFSSNFSSTNKIIVGGFKGWLGEILVFNTALATKERQQVEQYLTKKWKIKK